MRKLPRLIRRNLPFHQSQNIAQVTLPNIGTHLHGLRLYDWFHVFLRFGTFKSLSILLVVWTAMILIFAMLYLALDTLYQGIDCGLSGDSGTHFGVYFAFSLETCTTVGYGLPGSTNAYFENCPATQLFIYLQMVWSMIYNAFLLAFIFTRVAKCEDRAAQVIFTERALLKQSPATGNWIFSFRVADVDPAFPVVESHIKCYAKRGTHLIPMRILAPNDDTGASLFLSWPTEVQHEIDIHSPIYQWPRHPYQISTNSLTLRAAEGTTGSRDDYQCPVCGETYGTLERLRLHVEYAQLVEEHDEYETEGSHLTLDINEFVLPAQPTLDELRADFPDEVLVLLEGIDPLTSGTFQAMHSYTVDEVCWSGGHFANCISFSHSDTTIDLKDFHGIITGLGEKED